MQHIGPTGYEKNLQWRPLTGEAERRSSYWCGLYNLMTNSNFKSSFVVLKKYNTTIAYCKPNLSAAHLCQSPLNRHGLRIPTLAPEIEPKPSRAASRTRRCVSEWSEKWKQTVFGRGVGYSANLTTARAITPSLPILKAFLVNRDAIWS